MISNTLPSLEVDARRHRSAQSHLQGRAMIAAYVAAGQHAFRLPGADRRIPVFLQRFTDPDASETIFKYLASGCVHVAAGLDVDARPELIRGAVAGYQAVIAQLHAAFGVHVDPGHAPGVLDWLLERNGEAPCKIISYESDGLPREYVGDLLVASWADHRVERYVVAEKGASVTAERKPFVQGGKDFRPVGLGVAPDGSLFVSDWVLSNYELHGKGAMPP